MSEPNDQIIRESLLKSRELQVGAEVGVCNGWEMAQAYSGELVEHAAVRANAGVIDLSFCGCLRIWGTEAVQFLNGLVSNDVKSLTAGNGMRAAFLTGHGKVRALSRILNLGEEFLVITDPQTHAKVLGYVSPFSYAGDFKVEDVSEHYRLLSVQGPKAQLVLKEISFEPVPTLEEHGTFETMIAGHRAVVVKASHTGELGFDILVPESALADVWDFILLKGQFHSLAPVGLRALNSLRIEAAVPVYGLDVDETNMLLEVALADAVSFTKGCYTGQEAVAMATYRGHISKKLCGLALSDNCVPRRGDVVRKEAKEVGFVTSALQSPTLGSAIALAYVKYGFFEPGNNLEVEGLFGKIPAIVVELPFFKKS